MNPNSAIKKYYVGFAVLLVIMIGMLVYAFSQAGATKTDRATNKAVEQLSSKLGYGSSVPSSMADAGVTNAPDTIKYTKIDNSQYKVCITYKAASGIFGAGWTSLLGGAFAGAYPSSGSGGTKEYFDSSVEFSHKKGDNCQTVKPYSYDSNFYDNSSSSDYGSSDSLNGSSSNSASNDSSVASSACESSPSVAVSGQVTVTSVDTAKKIIFFDTNGQSIVDNSTTADVPNLAYEHYNESTVFCDGTTFAKTDVSAVKSGDRITIFLDATNDPYLNQLYTIKY